MDSILKLVYEYTYIDSDGRTQYHLNGAHPAAMQYINARYESNKNIYSIIDEIKEKNQGSNWDCFFRHSNFLSYYKRHFQTENIVGLDDVKDDGSIYVWPIEVGGSLDDFYKEKTLTFNGQTYTFTFVDTINLKLLNHIKNGLVKILINTIHDPLLHVETLKNLEDYFLSRGIDTSNITIIGGNTLDEYYKKYPSAKLKITYGYIMVQQAGDRLDNFPYVSSLGYVSDMVRDSDLNPNIIRPKKFLCWNRTMRQQRVWLAYLALKYNLLENSYFSFLNPPGGGEHGIKTQLSSYIGQANADIYGKQIHQLLPYDLDTHHLSANEKMGFPTNNNKKEFYLNSYVHITSETVFVENLTCPFFSEKTFHAMVNLQPFIYVGCTGALKLLRSWGIKTFSPFIDESYDEEQNPVKRFQMIEQEIKKLNDMPIQELHNWYHSVKDILLHNQKVLRNFSPSNPFENALNDVKKFYRK